MAKDNKSITTSNARVEVTVQPVSFAGGMPPIFTGPQTIHPPPMFAPNETPLLGPEMIDGNLGFSYSPMNPNIQPPGETNNSEDEEKKKLFTGVEEETNTFFEVENQGKDLQSDESSPYLDSTVHSDVPPEYEVARPPPQVMTALGPMPLPDEIRQKIPEKFVAKSIFQEREIYLAKKHLQERTIEIPHVQYEHQFCEVPKSFTVDRLVPNVKEIVKEIPREIYKPCIEEKVIEVPQGVKYVEVPLEVPCAYPPKIVPKPIVQYVERVIETIKPIVKEEIIEVPQTVVKHIPKIKTVEVPYFVPRYCEKIIEVPYKPSPTGELPLTYAGDVHSQLLPGLPSRFPPNLPMPGGFPSTPFTIGPMPLAEVNEIKLPYEAKIEVKVTQPEFSQALFHPPPGNAMFPMQKGPASQFANAENQYVPTSAFPSGGTSGSTYPQAGDPTVATQGLGNILPGEMSAMPGQGLQPDTYNKVTLPEGYKWGAPPNAPPQFSSFLQKYCAPCLQYPSGKPQMPPMMITCPPEVGKVSFASYMNDPDILTRDGVLPYQGFKTSGNAQMLFPPLAVHPYVPMVPYPAQPGTPDIRTLDAISGHQTTYAQSQSPALLEKLKTELYNQELQRKQTRAEKKMTYGFFNSACCSPEAPNYEPDYSEEDIVIGEGGKIQLRGVSNEPQ